MEEEEQDLATTVLTCEGDIRDPTFPFKLKCLICKLKRLISDEEKPFQITKVEPWNSVRVTFNIPREAAQRLRQLAELGDRVLRDLGILSVQVEGDQVITLTLAGQYNEPQEIVLRKTPETPSVDNRGNLGARPFELSGTDTVSASKSVEGNPKNIVQFLNQQTGLASASTSTPSSPASTSSAAVASVTAVVETLLGGQGSSQLANRDVGFRSPNVVAPSSNEPIPYLAATSAGSSRLPQNNPTRSQAAFGPFPFASMTHAMNTKHGAAHHQPLFHVQSSTCFPYTSRSQPFPTSTSRSATITQATSSSSNTLTSPATISSPQVAVSSIKQRSSQGTTTNPVFNNFVTHVSSSNMLMAVGTTTTTAAAAAASTSRANVALSSPLLVNLLQSDAHTNKMMPPPAPAANQLPKRKRKPRRPKDKSPDINTARGSSPTVTNIYSSLSSPPLHSSAPSSTCLHPVSNVSSPSFDPLGVLSSQTFNVSLPNIPNIPLSPPMNQVTGIHPQIQGQPKVHTGNLQLRTRMPFGTQSLTRLPSSLHPGGMITPPVVTSTAGVTAVLSTSALGITTTALSNRNESSLNKEVEKPQANILREQTFPSPPPPPPTDSKIKHLINPFTGQMEPMPSDEEEDESIGSLPPFPEYEGDTPENGQSERSLSDSGKDNPSDTDSGISKSHTDVSQSSTDWTSTELNKENEVKSESIKSANEELRQESTSASSCEKLKLRLKLDSKAMRDFIESENREKKSRSDNVGSCQSSHRVDVSIVNVPAIKKTIMSGNLSGGSEPRVPPLHISLRGPNAAVVVSPRKDMGIKDIYDPYSLDSMKTVSFPQKKSRSPRSLRPSSGDIASMCSSSSHSPKGSDSRRSPRSDNTKNFAREKEDSSSMEEFWNKNVKTLSGGGIVQMPEGESVSPISGMETILRNSVHASTKEKHCEEGPTSSASICNVSTPQVTTITPTVTTVALPVSTLPESSSSVSLASSELSTSEKRLTRTSEVISIASNRMNFHSTNVRKQDSHTSSTNAVTSRIFATISSLASSTRTQSLSDRSCVVSSASQNNEFIQPSLQSNRTEETSVSVQMEEPVRQLPDSTTQDKPSSSHLPQVSTSDQIKIPCSVQERTVIPFHSICNKEQTDRTNLPTNATPPLNRKTNSAISDSSPLQEDSISNISVVSSVRKESDQGKVDKYINCLVDNDSSETLNESFEDCARLSANSEISTNLSSKQEQISINNTSAEQSTIVSTPLMEKMSDLTVACAQKKNAYFHKEIDKLHLTDSFNENRTEAKELMTTCNKPESLLNTYATTSSNNLISQNEEFQSKAQDIADVKFLDSEKLVKHQNEEDIIRKASNVMHTNHTNNENTNRTEIISNHIEKLPKGCEFGFTTIHRDGDTANRISLNIDNEHVPENLCLIDMRKKSSSPVAKIISVDSFPIQSVPKVIEVPSIHISQAVPKSTTKIGLPGEVSSIPSLIPSHGDEFTRSIVTIHQNTNDDCYLSESTLEESSAGVVHTRLLPITAYSTGVKGNRISHIEKSEAVHINHVCQIVDTVTHSSINKTKGDSNINEKHSDGSSEESSLDSVDELHETEKENSNPTDLIKREADQSTPSENVCSGLSLKCTSQKQSNEAEETAIENECNCLADNVPSTDSNQLKSQLDECEISNHLNERDNNIETTPDKEHRNSDSACTAGSSNKGIDEETPEYNRHENNDVDSTTKGDFSDINETNQMLSNESKTLINASIDSKEISSIESDPKSVSNATVTSATPADFTISCNFSEPTVVPEPDSSHQELVSSLTSSSTVDAANKEDNRGLINASASEKEQVETSAITHPNTSSIENKPIEIVCSENVINLKEAVAAAATTTTTTVTTLMPSALNLTSSSSGVTSLISSSKCVSISSDNLTSSKVTLIFKGNISSSGSISQNPSSPSVVLPLSSSKTVPIKLVTLPGGHSGLSVRSTSNPAVVEIIGSTAGSSHTSASSNSSSSSSPVRLVVSKVSPVKTNVPVLAPSGTSSVRNMATVVVKSVVVTGTSSSIKIVPAKSAICPTTTAANTAASVSTASSLVLATSSVSTQLSTSLGTFEAVKPVASISVQSVNPTVAEQVSVTNSKEQVEINEKTDKCENNTETDSVNSVNSESTEETQNNLSLTCFSSGNAEKSNSTDSLATNSGTVVPDISLPEDLSKNTSCDLPELLPVLTEESINCRTSVKEDSDEISLQRKSENVEDSELCCASTDEKLSMPPTLEPSRGTEPTMPELSEISHVLSGSNDDDSVTEHSEDSANSEPVIVESNALVPKDGEKEQQTESECSLSLDSQSNIIVTKETETVETIRPHPLSNDQDEQDYDEIIDSTENSGGKSTLKEMSQSELCTSLVYSKPTKRKCSENAAELIKACMGVEDNPKRTCGAKQKSPDGFVSDEKDDDLDEKGELEQNSYKTFRSKREERKGRSQRSSSEDEMTLSELASKSRAKTRPNGEDHAIITPARMRNSNSKDNEEVKAEAGNVRAGGRRSSSNESRKSDEPKGRPSYRDGRRDGKKNAQEDQERCSPSRSGVQWGIRRQEQESKLLCSQPTNKDEIDITTAKRKTRGSGEHQESVPAKRRRCSKDSHR